VRARREGAWGLGPAAGRFGDDERKTRAGGVIEYMCLL